MGNLNMLKFDRCESRKNKWTFADTYIKVLLIHRCICLPWPPMSLHIHWLRIYISTSVSGCANTYIYVCIYKHTSILVHAYANTLVSHLLHRRVVSFPERKLCSKCTSFIAPARILLRVCMMTLYNVCIKLKG